MNNYTFRCMLYNQKEIEEEFVVDVEAPGQTTAKDIIEKELQKEWGYITKRIYWREKMNSDKYWYLKLEHIILEESNDRA